MLTRSSSATVTGVFSLVLGSALLGGCTSNSSDNGDSDGTESLKGAPINIGYINTEGKGAMSFPTYTVGAELAAKRINQDGGIDGRPVVLKQCTTDGSPATSLACANDFVEEEVVLVIVGGDLGFDGAVPVLTGAGIPAYGVALLGAAAPMEPTFFQIGAPDATKVSVPVEVFTELGVTGFDFAGPDIPAMKEVYDGVVAPVAKEGGLKTSLVTFDPASTDFSSVVSTLKANGTEAVFFSGSDEQCSGFARSATSLGYDGVAIMGTCTDFLEELTDGATRYLVLNFLYPPEARDDAPAAIQADLDQYLEDTAEAAKTDAFSLYGYGAVIDVGRVLQDVEGQLTPATVASAFAGLTEFRSFAGNTLDCADRPAAQGASCADALLVLEATDGGELKTFGEGFTTPPNS